MINIAKQCRGTWAQCNGRGLEKWGHRMHCTGVQVRDDKRWGTGWHWGPHSYEQLTNGQLKCRTIRRQGQFISIKKKEQVLTSKRYDMHSDVPHKFRCIIEMQTNGEQARYKSTLTNISDPKCTLEWKRSHQHHIPPGEGLQIMTCHNNPTRLQPLTLSPTLAMERWA